MPNVFIDHLDDLQCDERLGVVRSLTRKARVKFTPTDIIPNDYTVLWHCLTQAGVPVPFSGLSTRGHEMLALVGRTAGVVDKDSGTVDINLKYEHILDGPHQILYRPPSGKLFGKLRCSTVQKPTNFYRPNGNPNLPRTQLVTAHTFPVDQPSLGIVGDLDLSGLTIIQGGEVNLPFPQANFHLEGVIYTADPWDIVYNRVGRTNDRPFLGTALLHSWMLTEGQYELITTNPVPDPVNNPIQMPLYRFAFEWQYDSDTWDVTIAFNDQRTGKPPAGIKAANSVVPVSDPRTGLPRDSVTGGPYTDSGVLRLIGSNPAPDGTFLRYQPAGYWTIPYTEAVNFEEIFAATFTGGSVIVE